MPSVRQMRALLLCYVALPFGVAALNALRGTIYAPEMSAGELALFFSMMGVPSWVSAGLAAWMLVPRFQRDERLDMLLLTIAGIVGVVFSYVHLGFVIGIMSQTRWPSLGVLIEPGTYSMASPISDYLFGRSAAYFLALWLIANLVYRWISPGARFLGSVPQPATRIASEGAAAPAAHPVEPPPLEAMEGAQRPPFLRKLKQEFAGEVIAIVAEEHYIRVYTETGSDLILYRFSDALHEIQRWQDGLQVHRSYWVALRAIVTVEVLPRSLRLTLSNGLQVPVSQANRGLVQKHLQHLTLAPSSVA